MKKTILILLLFLSAFGLKAQEVKPSKEETIKYIDSWLKKNVEGVGNSGDMIVSKISFTGDKIIMVIPSSDPSIVNTYTSSGMDWSSYTSCSFENYGGFSIYFSKKNVLSEDGKYRASVSIEGPVIDQEKQKQLTKALNYLKSLSTKENGNDFFDK